MTGNHSIRWRLQIWQTVLLATVLGTLLVLHYQSRRQQLLAEIDQRLQAAVVYVLPSILPPQEARRGPPGRQPPREFNPEFESPERPRDPTMVMGLAYLENASESGLYVRIWSQQGEVLQSYGNVPADLAVPSQILQMNDFLKRTRGNFREIILQHPDGKQVLFGESTDEELALLNTLRFQLMGLGVLVVLVGFVGGWIITGLALRPIRRISQTAETIASGKHSIRIDLQDAPVELASLSTTLNTTFDHLEDSIEEQKRFSSDASHELRTPISVLIAQTQSVLQRERDKEQYVEALEACQRAGLRMKSLTESLLQLARLDSAGGDTHPQSIDLNSIAKGAIEDLTIDPVNHPILVQTTENPLTVEADPEQLVQAVRNLLMNAVVHNPEGCLIVVSTTQSDGVAMLSVGDDGIGIDPDQHKHLFDRFYRVDKARSRSKGGAGLGLSIVRALAEVNGGTINVESSPGKGARFTIRFPLHRTLNFD